MMGAMLGGSVVEGIVYLAVRFYSGGFWISLPSDGGAYDTIFSSLLK
jgi:hypothetical protein